MSTKVKQTFEEKCKTFFNEANGGNPISVGQLARVIRKASPCFEGDDQEIAQIFFDVDKDRDSLISWEEFSEAIFAKPVTEVTRAELEQTFKQMDADGSGKITREEVQNTMQNLELPVTPENMEKLMAEADKDNSGSVDIKEFLALFKDIL